MKTVLASMFSMLLLTSAAAWADDTLKTETKKEVRSSANKSTVKTETKTSSDPSGGMNGASDKVTREGTSERTANGGSVTTSEKSVEHDRPGIGNDTKRTTKHKVVRDAAGKVTQDETTVK